jgi:quercetin dioxygenase-like cupin family protein
MKHIPNGERPSRKAPDTDFTGTVWQDAISDPSVKVRVVKVFFEPGARTAWHTHPFGQTLYVTEGLGLARSEGGPLVELRPGDTVWFAPGEKHWHGAAPTTSMTHIAVHEMLDGKAADWMEKVSDAEYASS